MRNYYTKKKKVLEQKDWDSLKLLTEKSDLNDKQLSQVTGWSGSTISTIRRFDSLDSYRAYHRERLAKSNENRRSESPLPPPVVPATSSMEVRVLNDNLGKHAEILKDNTEALHKLEIALYSLRKELKEAILED